ncbi:hypothetical protein, partial [Microbacterium sp.]|uniref:hypothetical protein n=1 Tax=Microbacterium sp. TaxID=51671 RepID=UPI003C1BD763
TWIGVGAGGLLVAGGTGAAVRGAVNGVWSAGQGTPYELWHGWESMTGVEAIVGAGILAANPHNTQPWRLLVVGDTIELRSDQTRTMPLTDALEREHIASLGCAAENMVVAARAQGLDAAVAVLPVASDPRLLARIALSSGRAPSDQERMRAAAIPHRHSDRGPFTGDTLDPDTLASFTSLAAPDESARLVIIDEPASLAAISDVMVRATQSVVDDIDASEEAFAWFRNNRADIDRYRDGLTLDGQGLDDLTLAAAKILPRTSREDGDRFWLNRMRETCTKTAAAYGIVEVDDVQDPALQFAGGRLLERAHLHAAQLGLGFQHMNQVTERIDRARAASAHDDFSQDWSAALGIPADHALLTFRTGHSTLSPRPSPRRAVGDIASGL